MPVRIHHPRKRETALSFYGPLSLIFLLVVWACGMVFGFSLIYYALGNPFNDASHSLGYLSGLYVSGTSFFTLGLGDVIPRGEAARALLTIEGGTGFGFLAIVMGYFPVLYGAFSRREVSISLLDARAGSPPTAAELMRRHSFDGAENALANLLSEWERWSAELLESHISYTLLCYFRSQHTNQSWLSALTAMLDTSALLIAGVQGHEARQAQLTFAMARHAIVDLAQVFSIAPSRTCRIDCRGNDTSSFTKCFARAASAYAATASPTSGSAICALCMRDMPPHSVSICPCRCRHGSPSSRIKTIGSPWQRCAARPRPPTRRRPKLKAVADIDRPASRILGSQLSVRVRCDKLLRPREFRASSTSTASAKFCSL